MAATTQQPNTQVGGSGGTPALDRRAAWAVPGDPRSNTRPPGNGDKDVRETERSEEKLLAVLGR
jgi:hypothetical protein